MTNLSRFKPILRHLLQACNEGIYDRWPLSLPFEQTLLSNCHCNCHSIMSFDRIQCGWLQAGALNIAPMSVVNPTLKWLDEFVEGSQRLQSENVWNSFNNLLSVLKKVPSYSTQVLNDIKNWHTPLFHSKSDTECGLTEANAAVLLIDLKYKQSGRHLVAKLKDEYLFQNQQIDTKFSDFLSTPMPSTWHFQCCF